MRRTLVRSVILFTEMEVSAYIQSSIKQKLSQHFSSVHQMHFTSIGGGSINETYRIQSDDESVFCKINSLNKIPHLFINEKEGLELIGKQNIINVPAVIDCFEHEDKQFLLLEWIQERERTEDFWKKFGEQLAALHQQSSAYFGLEEDNYMGSVLQSNRHHQNWASFFIDERLKPMVKLCSNRFLTNHHLQQFEELYKKIEGIFEVEKPSLLHGDLWSGNFMCDKNAEPVLIDPAVYYGHRSVDLGMTTLFGGFPQTFYEAYHYNFPFPFNYREQWEVCNLYPLLVHLYLFGNSYLPQIEHTLNRLS